MRADLLATPEHERELRALEHELTRLSANLNAAEYRFAVLLEEFHRRGGHVGVGIKSCAHWLNWRCGVSLGAAREKVRVALALPGLPGIAQAFSTGELSFSKVRAMTRVATAGNEACLLELARSGTASQLAESFLATGAGALAGGERYQVMVHVDADTLPADGSGLRCELEDGPGVSAETARRLACDASRVCVHEDAEGNVLDIGRRSRQIPPAIARALGLRDRGCRFPGCTERRFVDGHHIVHWADGGHTRLDNLVLLCRCHHRAVHEEGFRVERVTGRLEFFTPRGKRIARAPTECVAADTGALSLARENVQRGLRIGALTGVTRWRGEALHLGEAVGALLELQ